MIRLGIFEQNNLFGRFCGKIGSIILVNLLFIISLLPVITVGAGMCAMYYSMLSLVRYGDINPVKIFWKGFRQNFKQATATWFLIIIVVLLFYADFRITTYMTGGMRIFQIMVGAVGIVTVLVIMYLFPIMATFEGKLRDLLKNCIYFIGKNPVTALMIAVFNICPMVLTYVFFEYLPLSAFLWCAIGFSLVAFINANFLYRLFKVNLDVIDNEKNIYKNDKKQLIEMEKLGM